MGTESPFVTSNLKVNATFRDLLQLLLIKLQKIRSCDKSRTKLFEEQKRPPTNVRGLFQPYVLQAMPIF